MIAMLFNAVFVLTIYSAQCHISERNSNLQHFEKMYQVTPIQNQNSEATRDPTLSGFDLAVHERFEAIQSELRDTNRRLQALERQNNQVFSVLRDLRTEMGRLWLQQRQNLQRTAMPIPKDESRLESRMDTLTKGVKIMIAAMRALNGDFDDIRNNISKVANQTGRIFEANKDSLTKHIFNAGPHELTERLHTTCISDTAISAVPKNCRDVQLSENETGIYTIQPQHASKPIIVMCDLETMGGGWTVIHNRYDSSQDFYQDWKNYKHGFGNLGGEFWLGLEHIHLLTGQDVNELLIELEDFHLQKAYAHYGAFSIGTEAEGFALKVLGGYSGDAGDSLIYHAGSRFSTKDKDQDSWTEGNCAQAHGSGWWYRSCDTSNLNGRYLNGDVAEQYTYQGMYWGEFKGPQYSLYKARMLVRPRDKISRSSFISQESSAPLGHR